MSDEVKETKGDGTPCKECAYNNGRMSKFAGKERVGCDKKGHSVLLTDTCPQAKRKPTAK